MRAFVRDPRRAESLFYVAAVGLAALLLIAGQLAWYPVQQAASTDALAAYFLVQLAVGTGFALFVLLGVAAPVQVDVRRDGLSVQANGAPPLWLSRATPCRRISARRAFTATTAPTPPRAPL